MFTGIIQAVGEIDSLQVVGNDVRLTVQCGVLDLSAVALGDSMAVNGVCLTLVSVGRDRFGADVSNETLSCTTLGDLAKGSRVNLEKALTLSSPLGGHLVSGHVDGIGTVMQLWGDGRSRRIEIQAPPALARYIAAKGSVCVDGISLTVNAVEGVQLSLNIVPHTLAQTTMCDYKLGQKVNLEVDIVARYLERLLLGDKAAVMPTSGVSHDTLRQSGFIKD